MQAKNLHRHFLFSLLGRILLAAIFLVSFVGMAGAYTLVLRDGRRLEVPPTFIVTKTTFTYEIAPGINKTVATILIDVPATERANNEAPGNFFRHGAVKPAPAQVTKTAQRTLTNRDLESIQARRLESEKAYERRRIELGLPSIEETRRREREEENATLAMLGRRAADDASSEAYWRSRAATLRHEMVAIDAQINYLRSRLAALAEFPLATHSLITSALPLLPLGSTSAVVSPRTANPGIFVAPRAGSITQRGRVLTNPPPSPFGTPRLARPVPGFGIPFGSVSAFPFSIRPFDYVEDAYDRTTLSDRLDGLLMERAALEAQWGLLEDEARVAKVPQVWLEP